MLIYLDANVTQYCADYGDFIFGDTDQCPVTRPELKEELTALRKLVELEQLAGGSGWTFAAPQHLMAELLAGKPSAEQREVYRILQAAWEDRGWLQDFPLDEDKVQSIEQYLAPLNLKDRPDRRHLAEAIALNASWFLTNDKDIIRKTRKTSETRKKRIKDEPIAKIGHTWIAWPSECLEEISRGLFLR